MTEDLEEKFRWMVMFSPGGKIYTYMHRTIPHMTQVIMKYFDEHGVYPHRIWVIVKNDEMQKVEITS